MARRLIQSNQLCDPQVELFTRRLQRHCDVAGYLRAFGELGYDVSGCGRKSFVGTRQRVALPPGDIRVAEMATYLVENVGEADLLLWREAAFVGDMRFEEFCAT